MKKETWLDKVLSSHPYIFLYVSLIILFFLSGGQSTIFSSILMGLLFGTILSPVIFIVKKYRNKNIINEETSSNSVLTSKEIKGQNIIDIKDEPNKSHYNLVFDKIKQNSDNFVNESFSEIEKKTLGTIAKFFNEPSSIKILFELEYLAIVHFGYECFWWFGKDMKEHVMDDLTDYYIYCANNIVNILRESYPEEFESQDIESSIDDMKSIFIEGMQKTLKEFYSTNLSDQNYKNRKEWYNSIYLIVGIKIAEILKDVNLELDISNIVVEILKDKSQNTEEKIFSIYTFRGNPFKN